MAPHLAVLCISCGMIFCLINQTIGAPQMLGHDDGWVDECTLMEQVKALCQKCATKSKSNIVYPMCCQAREEAREWCDRFLAFGLHNLDYGS